MPPPAVVSELVERFDERRDQYRSGDYNEAQLRQEFLNPFLEALGWDVYNKHNYAEAYKEVIHEASHDEKTPKRQIDATNGQIDHVVYELYGLTDEEIGIVEGASQ